MDTATDSKVDLFPRITGIQQWALNRVADRQGTTEESTQLADGFGMFRSAHYEYEGQKIFIAKREDGYGGDYLIIQNIPQERWEQMMLEAVETWRSKTEAQLEYILGNVQADIRLLKKMTHTDILRRQPGDRSYCPLFS